MLCFCLRSLALLCLSATLLNKLPMAFMKFLEMIGVGLTDAKHSIALNKTVVRGCVVARRDGHAGPQQDDAAAARLPRLDVMHCVTL